MSLKDTDVRTPGDKAIAKKFKLSLARVRSLVKQGANHEKEHNTNLAKAKEVARDHIGERPDYYKMLNKAEKTDKNIMRENTTVGHVRGLGYVSGDPGCGVDYVDQYKGTNMMSYDDDNGDKLKYLQQAHIDHHNKALGFNHFNPTMISTSKNQVIKANTALKETTTTYGGMGGNHSPGQEGDKYLENNVKNTGRDASIRDKHADENHHSLHNRLGFNSFRHTNISGHANRALSEATLNELGGSGEPEGYNGLTDSRSARKDVNVQEGEKLNKAKKVAMAGMTAANLYTLGDVASKAGEGRGSPKRDIVAAATTLPGAAGWGATGVHYAKKAYDYVKRKKMNEDKDPCWKGYEQVGMKKRGGKKVPNCVPVSEQGSSATRYTERPTYESAAWQRKAGKDPEGGLNRKGIASYRREHPGSKLSMAVTTEPSKLDPDSKSAKRRKSFCARMGGMKGPMKDENGKPTRKALALRKWNCEEQRGDRPAQMSDATERGIYEGWASIGGDRGPFNRFGDIDRRATFYGKKPKPTTTKNDEKDDTYKGSKQGGKVKFAKTVKEAQIDELKAETLGSYIKKASASRKKSLEGPKPDIKTWAKREHGIRTAVKQLTKEEGSQDKDWDETQAPFREQMDRDPSHLHLNKPDTKYAPGASGLTHTIHEETKMDNKLINEAIENIMEDNLSAMKENLMVALQEKAMEKLEERKKDIAANYFVKD
jgi:Domain of unknown function (DUF6321)